MTKKSRQNRFVHSLEGELKTEEKGNTMVVSEGKSKSTKRTKESLARRVRRFDASVQAHR